MRSILTPNVLQAVISDLGLNEGQKAKFLAFVRGAGIVDERVTYALHLLEAKTPRPAIRDRLMVRYEISREQAYRLIREAINTKTDCVMEMAHKVALIKAE